MQDYESTRAKVQKRTAKAKPKSIKHIESLPRLTAKPQADTKRLPPLTMNPHDAPKRAAKAKPQADTKRLPPLTMSPHDAPRPKRLPPLTMSPHDAPRPKLRMDTSSIPRLTKYPQSTSAPKTVTIHMRPAPEGSVFTTPLGKDSMRTAIRQANGQVRSAENRLAKTTAPAVALTRFPKLAHYTDKQREAILADAHKKFGPLTPAQQDQVIVLARLGDKQTRTALHKMQGASQTKYVNRPAEAAGAARLSGNGVKWSLAKKSGRSLARDLGSARLDLTRSVAKAVPKKQHMKMSGTTVIQGIPIPGLHQVAAAASGGLRQLQRPGAFVVGAADQIQHPAAHRGQNAFQAGAENFKSLRMSGSDLLPGYGNTTKAILGLGIDVGADPLNLIGGGVARVAEKTLTEASHAIGIAQDLHAAGKVAEAQQYEAKAQTLVDKAQRQANTHGIQLRLGTPRHNVTTSGATSAKLLKPVSRGGERLHDTKAVQLVGRNLNAGFRPAGVDRADWATFRQSEREARSSVRQGARFWERKGHAVNAALKDYSHEDVMRALEAAPKTGGGTWDLTHLDPAAREVAQYLRDTYKGMGHAEMQEGLLGSLRDNYVTHVLSKDARKAARKAAGRSGRKNPFDTERLHQGSADEINEAARAGGLGDKFSTNQGEILAERGAKSAALLTTKRYQDGVVNKLGRQYPGKLHDLSGGEAVYVMGDKGLRHVTDAGGSEARVVDAVKNMKPSANERLVVMPRAIGDRVQRGPLPGREIRLDAREFDDLKHTYNVAMNKWKEVLTVWNVGAYQLRNFAGDLWNARLADTDPKSLLDGTRAVALRGVRNHSELKNLHNPYHPDSVIDLGHGRSMSAGDLIHEMEQHGVVGSGYHQGELADMERMQGGQYAAKNATTKRLRPMQRLREAGGYLEDSVRAGTYLAARRRGMSAGEAADWTAKHHFDYSDLTEFERGPMRFAFPFWTFTARNTPLQAKRLASRPGRFANYSFAQEEGRKQAGLDEGYQDSLPSYYKRGFGVPINVHGNRKLLFPQWPITDLNRLAAVKDPQEQFKLTVQMLNPALKIPLEAGQNYSSFFRDPIWQDAEHPDAPHWQPAPDKLLKHLPMNVRVMLAGGDKDAAKKGLWTAKADYFFRIAPQTNLVSQLATSTTGSRNASTVDSLVSQATGVKVNEYGKGQRKKYAIDLGYDEVNKLAAQAADAKKLGQYARMRHLNKKKNKKLETLREARKAAGLPVTPRAGRKKALPGAIGGGSMPGSLTNRGLPGAIR